MALKEEGLLIVNPTVGIVQRITSVGTYVSEITIEEKTDLRGVAADEKASYVIDAAKNALRIFDNDDKLQTEISSDLDDPRDVAVDANRIYVLDKAGIAVFDKKNLALIKRYAGGLFRDPKGIAVSADRVLVADFGNGQVQVLGKSDFSVAFVIKDDLVKPWGVTADPKSGDIYVADPGAVAVFRFDKDGGFVERIDPITIRGFVSPRDVLLLNDMVYVADYDRILGFRSGVLTIRPSLRID
jgi:DNA-binding beta-propeller fold protein YncE